MGRRQIWFPSQAAIQGQSGIDLPRVLQIQAEIFLPLVDDARRRLQHRRHFAQQQICKALPRRASIEHRPRISIQTELTVLVAPNKRATEPDLVWSPNPTYILCKLVGEAVVSCANSVSTTDVEAVCNSHEKIARHIVVDVFHSEIGKIEIGRGIRFVRNRIDGSME